MSIRIFMILYLMVLTKMIHSISPILQVEKKILMREDLRISESMGRKLKMVLPTVNLKEFFVKTESIVNLKADISILATKFQLSKISL